MGPKASTNPREKEHLRRVKVIINMPEANKNFEASPSVANDVEFFSISVCFGGSFGAFVNGNRAKLGQFLLCKGGVDSGWG